MNHRKPFCEHHLLALLTAYSHQSLPLDLFISHYFKAHKALGSKDRAFIADIIYALIRWQALLDYFTEGTPSWEKRLAIYQKINLPDAIADKNIPLHIRASFPKVLFDLLENNYGKEQAMELCLVSNQPAPTTIRVNRLKTTRDHLLKLWQGKYEISPTPISPDGIVFSQKIHFFSLEEFKNGLFEVQDEGSQLVADFVDAKPGEQVLDYCAGSGGKTLAFAHKLAGKGQIYLHDIRPHVLLEAKRRLKRAAIQNGQVISADSDKLKKLKKKFDWVLVDAPCTGTGTMRRNPDMKWKFEKETLTRLMGQQRTIFEKALSFLKPEGTIIYATCSILKEENELQAEFFKNNYQLTAIKEFKSLPTPKGMDGFYAIALKKGLAA